MNLRKLATYMGNRKRKVAGSLLAKHLHARAAFGPSHSSSSARKAGVARVVGIIVPLSQP